jgi:hypothetical protein
LSLSDVFLVLFLFSVSLSFLLNYTTYKSFKPFNHLFAYNFTIIVLYFGLKGVYSYLLTVDSMLFKKVLAIISIGLVVSLIFGILEFLAKNIWSFSFDEIIPRPIVEDYSPLFLGKYIRIRSFVEESGHYAFYLEIFFPFVYFFLQKYGFGKNNSFVTIVVTVIFVICFFLTFSSAGIIIFSLNLLILYILQFRVAVLKKDYKFFTKSLLWIVSVCIILLSLDNYLQNDVDFNLFEVTEILTVGKVNSVESGYDRSYRIDKAMDLIINGNLSSLLFGFGPAAYDTKQLEPIIGLYFVLIFETGFLGLFFFLGFFVISIINIFHNYSCQLRSVYFVSIFSGLMHYTFIGNYYYPWLWLVMIIGNSNYKWEKRKFYM